MTHTVEYRPAEITGVTVTFSRDEFFDLAAILLRARSEHSRCSGEEAYARGSRYDIAINQPIQAIAEGMR